MEQPVLVFDGQCGFCMRALGWLRLLDRNQRIEALPHQRPGVPESIGATPSECAESLQWRGPDSRRLEGAAAVNAALGTAVGTGLPLAVYRRTSGIQDRLYRLVAENRRRLPGVSPWCAEHPEDCGTGTGGPSCGVRP
ncbi:MAG TPA: DCC1-like thiol-disulfide oxidoreductase family protein [Pseudonocardia sp.]|jgi:predicted DCC family thiol-disulfide oxidoreductase YuxK|nr:DCC1-like thiol-disulfide oxidoreductase family protein [Pseudonocardia sp.]